MIKIIDLETSTKPNKNGKLDPSPYMEENYILGVGCGDTKGDAGYTHTSLTGDSSIDKAIKISLQEVLDDTTLLVGLSLIHI